MKTLALALLALLALPSLARAADPAQPFVLSSPSGLFELQVEPQQASPVGDCSYELWRSGERLWTVMRPFVLSEGVVSDEGVALGFALTRTNSPGRGELEVTIWRIGARGEARVLEAIRQRSPRIMHGGPSPFMHGLWLDDSQTLGLAYYSDYELFSPEKREHYLAFDLETGDVVPLAWSAETPMDGVWRIADGMRPLVEIQTAPAPIPFQPVLMGTTALLPSVPQATPKTPATGPVRDVVAFEPLAGGGFEFVTCEQEYEAFHIQRVDASGSPVGTARVLDLDLDPHRALLLRFPDGAWLVSDPDYGFSPDNETYWIDPDPSKEPVQLPEEGLPIFEALAPFGPGEFVALGSRRNRRESSVKFTLGHYTNTGEILWEVPLEGWTGAWIEDDPFPRYELAVRGEGEARGWIFAGPEDLGPFFMTDRTGAKRGIVALPSEFAPKFYFGGRFSHDSSGRLFFDRLQGGPVLDPACASWEFSRTGTLTRWVDHGLLRASITASPDHASDVWVGLARDASRRINTLVCLDTDLHVLARRSRRPDGSFNKSIGDIQTGPRGEVAVLERDYMSSENFLTLTTTSFETGTTVRLSGGPPRLGALAAPWALISASGDMQLIHIETGRFFAVATPAEIEDRRILTTGLSPEGDELWYVTAEPLELWRYSLPKTQ